MKKKPYPLTDLTGGFNVLKDPIYIADKESPNIVCARFDKGIIKKDMGWLEFGLPLLGVPMLIDTYYKSDNIYRVLGFTTTSAYRWDSTLEDWYDITLGIEIDDCEAAWTASANVTSTAATDAYKKGSKSSKHVIAAGFTTGLASYFAVAAKNLTTHTHIHLWVKSTLALDAGDIKLYLDDTAACASPIEDIAFPALAADTWTRVSLAIAVPASCAAIVSVGLNVAVDKGANTIYLDDIRSVLESTGTITDPYSSCVYLDTYIVTNYKDVMKKYDGTTDYMQTLGGSPPKAKSICSFANRLLCCYTVETGTDHPFKLRWTDPGTIETWTASNYLEASDSPDFCTAVSLIGPKCALYKEQSIWDVLYIGGTVVFQLARKVDQIGTMAPSTVQRIRESHVFFAYDGIYLYNQAVASCISDNIYPMLFKTGEKTVNLGAVQCFSGFYVEELMQYWISLCEGSSTTPSLLLKYDIGTKSYIKRVGNPITCMGYYERVAANPTWATITGTWATVTGTWGSRSLPGNAATTLLGFNTGQIYEDNRYTTTTDEFILETKDFMYGHATRVVECRVDIRYGGYTLYYSTDGGATWVTGTTFVYTADWAEHVYYMNITCQRIRFKISTTEPTIEIRWIEPWHIDRARSKELTIA